MTRTWAQRLTIVAVALVVTGCSNEPVQCGPCPSPASFYVNAGQQPSGTAVRICMEGHGCTEQVFPRESDTSKTVHIEESITLDENLRGVDYPTLDGATVTATLIHPSGPASTPTITQTTSWHDGGDGECACSYLSTDTFNFTPAR